MKVVALMGKAGSGKDTILQNILKRYPDQFHEIISYTTRPPREGEQNGVNYNFITDAEFEEKVNNGDMLEVARFNGWNYGSAYSSFSADKVNIGIFNPDGIDQLLKCKDIEVDVYYVRTPDKERLLRQLNREDNPNVREIVRRFDADWVDFDCADLSYMDYTDVYNMGFWDIQAIADLIAGRNR